MIRRVAVSYSVVGFSSGQSVLQSTADMLRQQGLEGFRGSPPSLTGPSEMLALPLCCLVLFVAQPQFELIGSKYSFADAWCEFITK
jgi:hypothetical protein